MIVSCLGSDPYLPAPDFVSLTGTFFFATLRYEIFIDEVKPKDLSASFLKEFMALPTSYFAVGAPMKYCKCVFHVCFCISLKHDI